MLQYMGESTRQAVAGIIPATGGRVTELMVVGYGALWENIVFQYSGGGDNRADQDESEKYNFLAIIAGWTMKVKSISLLSSV